MAYPAQPLDANGVPIGGSYVPNDNFYALQASARKKVDTATNTYIAPIFEVRTQEDIRSGIVYSATTGKLTTATNPSLVVGASLFNPAASSKTVLVLSAKVMQSAGANAAQLNFTTTDPQLGAPTALTAVNLSAGGTGSTLTGLTPNPLTSSAAGATASVSVTGTLAEAIMLPALTPVELCPAGMGIILPSGAANGIAIFTTIVTPATQFYAMSFKWVEY